VTRPERVARRPQLGDTTSQTQRLTATGARAGRTRRRWAVALTLVAVLASVAVADLLGVAGGYLPPSLGLPGWLDPSGQNPGPAVHAAADHATTTRAAPPGHRSSVAQR